MPESRNYSTDCRIVGDYVDNAGHSGAQGASRGEAVPTRIVAEFVEVCTTGDNFREFTVLLKDGRVIGVRGHGLKYSPHAVPGEDVYSIVRQGDGEEIVVALFKSAEVAGIFHGEIRPDRRIA
jgi:hypothetical protein